MADNPPLKTDNSANQSNINGHPFHTMNPSPTSKDIEDIREETQQKTVIIYKDQNDADSKAPKIEKSTIFGSTFMITNICFSPFFIKKMLIISIFISIKSTLNKSSK